MTEPVSMADTIEKFLAYLGAPPVRAITTLEEKWPEIVGPALAVPTRPIELVDGVLVIGCDDASWASQVRWMEAEIKERFSELFDDVEIRRIQPRITP